jgi:hypothetical protein
MTERTFESKNEPTTITKNWLHLPYFNRWRGFCIAPCAANGVAVQRGKAMDPKLTMLFLLIGAIIGLSHLSDENMARMKQQFAPRRWRKMLPGQRKS